MGLSPELFKRLSRLNRGLLAGRVTSGDRVGEAAPSPTPGPAFDPTLSLEKAVPGTECRSRRGRFYRIVRPAEAFWPKPGPADEEAGPWFDGRRFLAEYRQAFLGGGAAVLPQDLHEGFRPLVETDQTRVTYLDIETCGLAGEPVFLVGLMWYRAAKGRPREGVLQVEQYLARDYSEEAAMLEAVWQELAATACLVTFNGKTFDLPTVEARSAACGLFDRPAAPAHVDLLHEARRRWRRELPNCRLQTLEQLVCGRRRAGDIPGGDIPAAYHEFVRARLGDDPLRRALGLRRLQTIIHHNGLDLLTMAELAARILSGRF